MRTKDEMMAKAESVAITFFYSDVGTPWEPFEHWPEEQLGEEIAMFAEVVYLAMLWVQEGTLT
jgi:hypothetical protein